MPAESVDKPAAAETNVKETVESILIAFILAFIFRGFVVEAFVIPTGSMAPTLYGAHMRFRCPDCGTTFDVGYNGARPRKGEEAFIPAATKQPIDYYCPNCGYEFPRDTVQRVRFGDRILVLKYLYLFQQPQRGDTVVFKSPSEDDHNPIDPDYSVNYIKRLVGIGPETLVILDGDVYVGPFGSRDPRQFKIWRKPDHVQNVLWRTIYDNDHIPRLPEESRGGLPPWKQPWTAGEGNGWNLGTGGRSAIFNFNAAAAGSIHFDSKANSRTHGLNDYLVYDADQQGYGYEGPYVSDLKLDATYTRTSGDGPLEMQLTKYDQCFTARITRGKVTLVRSRLTSPESFQTVDEKVIAEKAIPALDGTHPVRIELTNVDYRVSVRIDDTEVISHEYDPMVDSIWRQGVDLTQAPGPFSRPRIAITATGQQCTIEHLQLARDIFYQNARGDLRWGIPRQPVDLKAGEYFVLGDNSAISGDARFWGDPIELEKEGMLRVESGRVPEQFMLGKAFFVYWPAGYPVPSTGINIVPDFGDMRFIH